MEGGFESFVFCLSSGLLACHCLVSYPSCLRSALFLSEKYGFAESLAMRVIKVELVALVNFAELSVAHFEVISLEYYWGDCLLSPL